jgi:ribosomal RNA-processing protein 12
LVDDAYIDCHVHYLTFFFVNCLSDILSSEFEEARFSSVEAFKGLIDHCIDETLVSQGIAQMKARHRGLKSDPTIIEKICAILEGLLDFRYSDVWDRSFNVISVAFDKLGMCFSTLAYPTTSILFC